jgi:hypothetical protein
MGGRGERGSAFRADTCALSVTPSITTEVSKKINFVSLIFRVLEVQIFVLFRVLATALKLRAVDIGILFSPIASIEIISLIDRLHYTV